jgi:hypothetical protein
MLRVIGMANGIVNRKGIAPSIAAERKLVGELAALLPDASFLVDGVRVTGPQLVAELRQHITAEEQIGALLAQLNQARKRIKPVRRRVRKLHLAAKLYAAVALGDRSPEYQQLGFDVPKLRKTTAKAKAVGVIKAKATRTARGTKGSRQKQAIHG